MVDPEMDSDDGNIQYLGDAKAIAECELSCAKQPWCSAYTWVDSTGGTMSNMCYGVHKAHTPIMSKLHTSGLRKEGYCPKLMHRYGMCDAGKKEESYRTNSAVGTYDDIQNFTAGKTTTGTNWAGYMNSTILPIGSN
jgi:hypothetical protein